MILIFRTDRSGQTVQTHIRLLLEEQSDQGLHCLLFHLRLFDRIPEMGPITFESSTKFRNFTVPTESVCCRSCVTVFSMSFCVASMFSVAACVSEFCTVSCSIGACWDCEVLGLPADATMRSMAAWAATITIYEPHREKTGFLLMRKQRRRSASR